MIIGSEQMNKRVTGILQGVSLLVCICIVVWELHSVLSNLCITLFTDRTRPQHREPTEVLETSRNFNKSTGLTIMCNEKALYIRQLYMPKIPRTTTKQKTLCHTGRMRATEKRWVDFGRIVNSASTTLYLSYHYTPYFHVYGLLAL